MPLDLTEVPGIKQCFGGRGCHLNIMPKAGRPIASATAVQLAIGQCLDVPDVADRWSKALLHWNLDDSYPCVFTRACADGEIVTIGVYVDNLQIVHSVPLNASGVGLAGSYYNEFVTALKKAWGVVDEGPMEDLLGIEVEHLRDGAIKLHQRKYIEKVVSRFLPKGALAHVQKSSLPYSHAFMERMVD